jgi:dTDP-4-amino-4,6-dideoxygalactose transaminase
MVPLLDLTRQYQELKPELDAAVLELLASGQYVLGPAVEEFEAAAAAALGVEHAIGVANGTDALQLALQALGVGPGDEVITTPFTFIATAEVVSRLGATPVFADITADTFNLDPAQIEAAITPRTKAIIPVHLFGHPAPMNEINAIARRHGLPVLGDAAQAWGAALDVNGVSQKCGALAEVASFSFFPSKNLGACGEGGLITTNNDEIADQVRMLRVHGQSRRYIHDEVGTNSRLHSLQAAILSVKLPHAARWNEARRANAARYDELLADLPLTTPIERAGAYHVYHQYTLRASHREPICEALTQAAVGWAIYYPVCLHLQPVYRNFGYREGQFPVAEAAAREVFSLPIFPELRPDELEIAAAAVRAGCRNAASAGA